MKLETLLRSAIRFDLCIPDSPTQTGTTRFGGIPDVDEEFTWPRNEGCPLMFFLQIDCREISSLDKEGLLPDHGMIYFFYDIQQMPWMVKGNTKGVKVLYTPENEMLRQAVLPDDMYPEELFPQRRLRFFGCNMLPSDDDLAEISPQLDRNDYKIEGERAQWMKNHNVDFTDRTGTLGGYARIIQNSMLNGPEDAAHSVLLLQLESIEDEDDEFSFFFSDCGSIYIYINKEDLKQLDFSKIRLYLQSY